MRDVVMPLLLVAQLVPKVAIAPLLLIWFGYGLFPKILVAFLVAFFPIVVNGASGLASVQPELMDLGCSLQASRWQTFWKFRVPTALPELFSGMKIAVTLAIIGAIIGEFVGGNRGLGYLIIVANQELDTALAFAAIFLLSVAGIILYAADRDGRAHAHSLASAFRAADLGGKGVVRQIAAIEIADLCKTYSTADTDIHTLAGVSFRIEPGEFVSVLGPSGCGKTTILRIIAGLTGATSGTVRVDGAPVKGPQRKIGLVFQVPALMQWRTALQNVLLPAEILRLRSHRQPSARTRAAASGRACRVRLALPARAFRWHAAARRRSHGRSRTTLRSCCWTSLSAHWT